MRFIASVIGGGIMDRYPDMRVGTLECGFGWLPFWGKRMDEQYAYVGSTQELKMKPSEYLKSGRYFCSVERHEGDDMFRMVRQLPRRRRLDVRLRLPAFGMPVPGNGRELPGLADEARAAAKLMAGNADRFFKRS